MNSWVCGNKEFMWLYVGFNSCTNPHGGKGICMSRDNFHVW